MAVHPELVARGFHVLHVNPCGYNTPSGFDESLRDDQGGWPVLAETARSGGQAGYVDWLADALCAVAWARSRPEVASERLGLLGTSQGGGTALLLGSILRDSCRSLCADVPFLTGFRLALEELEDPGVYGMVYGPLMQGPQAQLEQARRAVSFVDTLCHAHRLTMPVLLTAGLVDKACPPETIEALFAALPGTASLTRIAGQGHASTVEFLALASAWFTLHV
jgi:cephalosporin-C deacetylase-like acetyl esterase